mgnify:CR=1 FL=1
MSFIFLKDTEIVEAVVGSIAFFVIIWYFRDYLQWTRVKSAAFIFPIVWAIRKIGVNLYNYLKKKGLFSLTTIKNRKISHFL